MFLHDHKTEILLCYVYITFIVRYKVEKLQSLRKMYIHGQTLEIYCSICVKRDKVVQGDGSLM